MSINRWDDHYFESSTQCQRTSPKGALVRVVGCAVAFGWIPVSPLGEMNGDREVHDYEVNFMYASRFRAMRYLDVTYRSDCLGSPLRRFAPVAQHIKS